MNSDPGPRVHSEGIEEKAKTRPDVMGGPNEHRPQEDTMGGPDAGQQPEVMEPDERDSN
jgi:hypothetical protein